MTDKIADMEKMIANVDVLHSSPKVAFKALSALEDSEFDVRELTEILKADPALATSILKLVNSAYFGISREVSSLQQAVTLIGPRTLRLAVLSFGLLKQLNDTTPAQICQEYWKRSLTMAAAASRIAGIDGHTAQDVAYTAGLLADVGVLVFSQFQPERYLPIYDQHHNAVTLLSEEEGLFGFNHAEFGAFMLQKWNLPDNLCGAILRHHQPALTLTGLDFAVATSNVVATSLWSPDSTSVVTAQKLLQESFAVDAERFISFATEIQQTVNENAELFSVNINETIDCEKLLELARQKYHDIAMEAVLDVDSMSSVLGGNAAI